MVELEAREVAAWEQILAGWLELQVWQQCENLQYCRVRWCTGLSPMGCIIEGLDNSSSPLSPRSWLLVDGTWLLASTG